MEPRKLQKVGVEREVVCYLIVIFYLVLLSSFEMFHEILKGILMNLFLRKIPKTSPCATDRRATLKHAHSLLLKANLDHEFDKLTVDL